MPVLTCLEPNVFWQFHSVHFLSLLTFDIIGNFAISYFPTLDLGSLPSDGVNLFKKRKKQRETYLHLSRVREQGTTSPTPRQKPGFKQPEENPVL